MARAVNWSVHGDEKTSSLQVRGENDEVIAIVLGEDRIDNAKIIAAAPEMLLELRALLLRYGIGDGMKRGSLLRPEDERRLLMLVTRAMGS